MKGFVRGMTTRPSLAGDEEYRLWVLLHQTCDALSRARENELRKAAGISRMQAAVLFIVKAIAGPVTPAEISRWLFREPHTVSGILDRMERQGLVRKAKDLERKNMIRVALTEKGEEAYHRTTELKAIRNILLSLSKEELENLRKYLETMRNKAIEELRIDYELPFP